MKTANYLLFQKQFSDQRSEQKTEQKHFSEFKVRTQIMGLKWRWICKTFQNRLSFLNPFTGCHPVWEMGSDVVTCFATTCVKIWMWHFSFNAFCGESTSFPLDTASNVPSTKSLSLQFCWLIWASIKQQEKTSSKQSHDVRCCPFERTQRCKHAALDSIWHKMDQVIQ